MQIKYRRNYRFIGWLIMLVMIGCLYVYYFYAYVPKREAMLYKRGFRILSEYGNNMTSRRDYFMSRIKNFEAVGINYSELDSSLTRLINSVLKNTKLRKDNTSIWGKAMQLLKESKSDRIEQKMQMAMDSHKDFYDKYNIDYFPESMSLLYNTDKRKSEFVFNPKFVLTPDRENVNSILLDSLISLALNRGNLIYFTLNPQRYFEGLKYDNLFENISIINKHTVLYNENESVTITNLDEFGKLRTSQQGGSLHQLTINGDSKHLLILPYNFLGKQVNICGIISSEVFKDRTRTINTELLFLLAGLVMILLTSFPVFKICLINKQERLNTSDANFATISLFFGIALLFILAYGSLRQYIVIREGQKNRLEEISDTLYANFVADINDIVGLYYQLKEKGVLIRDDSLHYKNLTDAVNQTIFDQNRQNQNVFPIDSNYYPTIPINDILYINKDGMAKKAVTKYYIDRKRYNELDLSRRDYYKMMLNEKDSWIWNDSIHFYLQSIQAYGSGLGETALSFPLVRVFNNGMDTTQILAITSTLPSVYHQVLPSDITVAVINKDGHTLYHSEKYRTLHENFIVESGSNPYFNSILDRRLSKTMKINYLEKTWIVYIRPIQNTPLYYLTLLDLSTQREKNARIILLAIYMLIIFILFIFLGTLIILYTRPKNYFLKSKTYAYHWLIYSPFKSRNYHYLLIIICILFIGQITAIFTFYSLRAVILYHLLTASLSIFYSSLFLDSTTERDKNYGFIDKVLKLVNNYKYIYLVIALILTVSVFFTHEEDKFAGYTISLIIAYSGFIVVFTSGFKFTQVVQITNKLRKYALIKYRAYTFLWLILLSVVPSYHFYHAVKEKEKALWDRYEKRQIATSSEEVIKELEIRTDSIYPWVSRTLGNKIMNLQVDLIGAKRLNKTGSKEYNEFLYKMIPTSYHKVLKTEIRPYLYDADAESREIFSDDTLYYKTTGNSQLVISDNTSFPLFRNKLSAKKFLVLWCLMVLFTLGIYELYCYLSDHVLYTSLSKWIEPGIPKWKSWLASNQLKRVVLITLNPEIYIKETAVSSQVYTIKYNKLINNNVNELMLNNQDAKIFITGLEWQENSAENHIELLDGIEVLIRKSVATVIICSPFELEYIRESLFEYFGGENMNEIQRKSFNQIMGRWEVIFKDFKKYIGVSYNREDKKLVEYSKKGLIGKILARECAVEPEIIENFKSVITLEDKDKMSVSERERLIMGIQQFLEPRYYYFWRCCLPLEKLILYDLAEDGMVNIKNGYLINRLISKGLIVVDPVPRIFSESFKNFILTSVREEEAKDLEKKLGVKGQWRSLRFFIITVLLAVALFLFVIQGRSVDKAIGLMTAIIALIPAIIRLFDTGINLGLLKKK